MKYTIEIRTQWGWQTIGMASRDMAATRRYVLQLMLCGKEVRVIPGKDNSDLKHDITL